MEADKKTFLDYFTDTKVFIVFFLLLISLLFGINFVVTEYQQINTRLDRVERKADRIDKQIQTQTHQREREREI